MNTETGARPIRIESVSHRYGRQTALDDLTLELPPGQLV